MFKKDKAGNLLWLKKLVISTVGLLTWRRYFSVNKTKVEGIENLNGLPGSNVLFVCNHQTYFADVIALYHVFCNFKNNKDPDFKYINYLFKPKANIYYIAADETMKEGFLPKVLTLAGCVTTKRTWREAGQDVNRKVELKDVTNIANALESGWVITFPQGTTTPFAPGRRGVTLFVKKFNPVVIPVVLKGFNEAFDKKGIKMKKSGVQLSITFKPKMNFEPDESADSILSRIMDAIEQSESFRPKP